jgi:GDP-4-dehydro-6-deoxy-D-mannose reductase
MTGASRVLVTGARGALGGNAARLLAESGAEVYAVVRPGSTPRDDLPDRVRWIECDLRDEDQVRAALTEAKPSAVLHTAGIAGTSDLGALFQANVLALANVIEAVDRAAVERILVIGSAAEYVPTEGREPLREDHALGPSNRYGLSKLFQFELCRQQVRAGMPIVYARLFNMIGPGVSGATAVGDITRRLAAVIEKSDSDVLEVGDLNRWRDYTDVRDAAAACVTLLREGRPGDVYNVCTGVPVALSDVVERLVSMAGRAIRLRRVERDASAGFQVGDPSRMRELGWTPTYDLDTSLRNGLESELRAVNRTR